MPIGASKVGALGGLVPGGSVTFNASGTWDVPPGVKVVSITGKGGTGNPGVAGNPGNPGNPGSGGAGGGGGRTTVANGPSNGIEGFQGGAAFKLGSTLFLLPSNTNPSLTLGGCGGPYVACGPGGNSGQQGQAGTAGTAGNPGTAGNTGQSSSALCNTFPGGAGGNAPPGGAAGNGGSGGQGGGGGGSANWLTGGGGGSAGNGGGSGMNGAHWNPAEWRTQPGIFANGPNSTQWGPQFRGNAIGGSGAGSVNSGQPGGCAPQGFISCNPQRANQVSPAAFPLGMIAPTPAGNLSLDMTRLGGQGTVVPNTPIRVAAAVSPSYCVAAPPAVPNFMTGGYGGYFINRANAISFSGPVTQAMKCREFDGQFNPVPERPSLPRTGAGGGRSGQGSAELNQPQAPNTHFSMGGGGGGGGRGNAGNAGGNSPTISGTAATPVTYNCVPVTPGTPTPITVGAPGGQIVISWNPQ